jgi:predicted O-methyltransferase YrrM
MRAAFDELVELIAGTPVMTPEQGWRLWQHFERTRPRDVLDIGTLNGTSAAYMAGALRFFGGGHVVTVDNAQLDQALGTKGICERLLERCGLSDMVTMVRTEHSDYAWWLVDRVRANSRPGQGCTPLYDFVYLDGNKLFDVNAAAVILIEQLLRPGGWLLMDDLAWTYSRRPGLAPSAVLKNGISLELSTEQVETPMLRAVFDLVVATHPAFGNLSIDGDTQWGWAEKTGSSTTTMRIDVRSTASSRELLRELARRGLRWPRRTSPG